MMLILAESLRGFKLNMASEWSCLLSCRNASLSSCMGGCQAVLLMPD
jgi:hypothetical protein